MHGNQGTELGFISRIHVARIPFPDAAATQRRYVALANMRAITRSVAIERLALWELERLSSAERAEQLETMTLENWADWPRWSALPQDVREEFDGQSISGDPSSQRYDPVLLIWLRFRYLGATNAYLRDCLTKAGADVADVTGAEDELLPCPCCGRASLSERNSYDICKVCWWEDDGQDNSRADTVMGGPNYGLSLTQGRVNFLVHGICNPARDDLRSHQDPPEKYVIGRVFALSKDGDCVIEPGSQWSSRAFVR